MKWGAGARWRSVWTDRVRNELSHRVNAERITLHTIKRRKANWIFHILLRNCFLKPIIEIKVGRTEITGRRGIRYKQLLHDLKETGGYAGN